MPILTIVPTGRTHPVETVFVLFNGFNEVSACDDGVWHLAKLGSRVLVDIDIRLLLLF